MNYQLFNDNGTIEAVIDDNCGIKKFYSIASALSGDLDINFIEKKAETNGAIWYFKYNGHLLKLRYDVYSGISIHSINSKDNGVVTELAEVLKKNYF